MPEVEQVFISIRGISQYSLNNDLNRSYERMAQTTTNPVYSRILGHKFFELTDHLGNVNMVFTDEKEYDATNGEYIIHQEQITHYYAFGWAMPKRSFSSESYRYGFNGQEEDKDLAGGNGVVFKYRIHDARLGRFWC